MFFRAYRKKNFFFVFSSTLAFTPSDNCFLFLYNICILRLFFFLVCPSYRGQFSRVWDFFPIKIGKGERERTKLVCRFGVFEIISNAFSNYNRQYFNDYKTEQFESENKSFISNVRLKGRNYPTLFRPLNKTKTW